MPRPKKLRQLADLTPADKDRIRELYVNQEMTMAQINYRMPEVSREAISKYLRAARLTRSSSDYAKKSLWAGQNRAKFAEEQAKREAEQYGKAD